MKYYDSIPNNLKTWALQQPMFFVASAPLMGRHVNCSPKGLLNSTFTIFSPNKCGYIDATGSGNETISHIYEQGNGRVVVMFCSFDKLPRILRFWCKGSVIEHDDPRFESTLESMGQSRYSVAGARAVVMFDVWKVGTSCGTGVPIIGKPQNLEEEAENDDSAGDGNTLIPTHVNEVLVDRQTMSRWAEGMIKKDKLKPYQRDNNSWSLDGLAGMKSARKAKGEWMILRDLEIWSRRTFVDMWQAFIAGIVIGVMLVVVIEKFGILKVEAGGPIGMNLFSNATTGAKSRLVEL